MNQIKKTLEAIYYPVKAKDCDDILAELHCNYGAQKVGTSINGLGDAAPLYIRSGDVAFMVDNEQDLRRACSRINAALKEREGQKPVNIKREVRARIIPELCRQLENEIELAFRVKRSLGIVDTDYTVKSNPDTRTQTRKPAQIIDDLLSDDKSLNAKAADALKAILLIDRAAEHDTTSQ